MPFPLIAGALGLAQFAPVIARWLGGDQAEQMAEQVIQVAQKITGQQDPSMAAQMLRENSLLVSEFQKAMMEIDARLQLAMLEDRQNARNRDVAFVQSGRRNSRADVMVISAAIGLIMCLASLAIYAHHLPGEATGIISTIAGIFGACLKDAYAFEFGSSRGSKEKDSTVAAMVERSLL
jgi:Flp pilus assembly protein TadB